MSQNLPTTIGKYQIIREIARSNDIVYEAYDPKMTRRVAVKELHMPGGASQQQKQDRIKRFEREARAAGSLVHPNIVTVYEVGTDGDKYFIAMEYLTGRNLRKEIDKSGFIDPIKAIEITLEVLEALSFAHEHGVIHRDIKPDNVQLLDDGQIKLTDFGIARLTFEPNITMDGQVFGTPSYMSPEQINGNEIDVRSDIFSVGVVLYEMVSGSKPFQGDSVVSITYAIMNKRPDQPQQATWALWDVIQRSLEKTPDLRQKSAGEMTNELQNVLRGMKSGSVVIDPAPTYQPPVFNPNSVASGPPPIYNPYLVVPPQQTPQPMRTPYGTPMPPQQGVYQAPYNPQQQPYTPYQPPANQVPIYYPPPPRQPLIKPEVKQAIAKFFIAVLLIGATIGFVILVINALTNTSAAKNTSTNPPLQNGAVESSSDAEPIFQDFLVQADLAVDNAMGTSDPAARLTMWLDADAKYMNAVDAAASDSDKAFVMKWASDKYLATGDLLAKGGERTRAREAYRRARGFSSGDVERTAQLDEAIQQVGG